MMLNSLVGRSKPTALGCNSNGQPQLSGGIAWAWHILRPEGKTPPDSSNNKEEKTLTFLKKKDEEIAFKPPFLQWWWQHCYSNHHLHVFLLCSSTKENCEGINFGTDGFAFYILLAKTSRGSGMVLLCHCKSRDCPGKHAFNHDMALTHALESKVSFMHQNPNITLFAVASWMLGERSI